MAAGIARLGTKSGLLRATRVTQVRQLLLELEPEAPDTVSRLLAVLDRGTAAEKGWTFVMLSPAQNLAVVRWLRENSERPGLAMTIWAELFVHMRMDTGEIVASRQLLADAVGSRPTHVSAVLNELVKAGALIRHMDGKRAQFLMNPRVGTCLTGAAREKAQAGAPQLELAPRAKSKREKPKIHVVAQG